MAILLAERLQDLTTGNGARTIQVVYRRVPADSSKPAQMVDNAESCIRQYLAAWPKVDHLRDDSEFTAPGLKVHHEDGIAKHPPLPGQQKPYGIAATKGGIQVWAMNAYLPHV